MSDYRTIAVPFGLRGNRQFLSQKQIMEDPALEHFVRQFPNCFEWDDMIAVMWFYPDGDSPRPISFVSITPPLLHTQEVKPPDE